MNLQHFRKGKLLTNRNLRDLFMKNPELMNYIPNNVKWSCVPKIILYEVIYSVRKDLYDNLVEVRDKELERRSMKAFSQYSMEITEEFKTRLIQVPELKGI